MTRALANCQPSSSSSPLSIKNTASIRNEAKETSGGLGSPLQTTEMRSLHRERVSLTESVLDVDEEPLLVMGERKGPTLPHLPLPSVQEEEAGISDFNSTLTTDGEEERERFGDEEEWGSFKSTPMQIPPVLASVCTTSAESSPCSSPRKLIALTSAYSAVPHSSPCYSSSSVSLPVNSSNPPLHPSATIRKVKVLTSQGKTVTQQTNNPPLPSGNTVPVDSLPPQSSLVAKLFPSLSKERVSSQTKIKSATTDMQQPFASSQASVPQDQGPSLSTVHRTFTPLNVVDSSAIEGVSDEIQDKLSQLEREINTFKSENAALERMRIEKEQV